MWYHLIVCDDYLFNAAKSKLSTRILRSADVDHDGRLSFKEYVLNAWIFATKDFRGVCEYAFDNFDLDGSGELKIKEVREMIADVYAGQNKTAEELDELVSQLLRTMDDGRHDRIVTKTQFCENCLEFKELLYPALQIQVNIKRRIVSEDFWEAKIQDFARLLF